MFFDASTAANLIDSLNEPTLVFFIARKIFTSKLSGGWESWWLKSDRHSKTSSRLTETPSLVSKYCFVKASFSNESPIPLLSASSSSACNKPSPSSTKFHSSACSNFLQQQNEGWDSPCMHVFNSASNDCGGKRKRERNPSTQPFVSNP